MNRPSQSRKTRRNSRSKGQNLGIDSKPRVCVFRSNKHIYVQAIDDSQGKIIFSSSSLSLKEKGKKEDVSETVGKDIGAKLSKGQIESVIFDRNGYKYHGRVKKLVEAIRTSGINI